LAEKRVIVFKIVCCFAFVFSKPYLRLNSSNENDSFGMSCGTRESVHLIQLKTLVFIAPDLWPPIVLDLNRLRNLKTDAETYALFQRYQSHHPT